MPGYEIELRAEDGGPVPDGEPGDLHVHGPSANNPKLVNYLAAGSIQGLRPLRYEKRVARNRVIALTVILVAVLGGILKILLRL